MKIEKAIQKKWITIQEAMDYLGVKRTTIYNYRKQGILVYKIFPSGKPYIDKAAIDALFGEVKAA